MKEGERKGGGVHKPGLELHKGLRAGERGEGGGSPRGEQTLLGRFPPLESDSLWQLLPWGGTTHSDNFVSKHTHPYTPKMRKGKRIRDK